MEQSNTFRRAEAGEVPHIFHLIRERVRWMEERGLRQWNVTGYLEAYPLPYYQEAQARGRLFVLAEEGGRPVCAAVLLEEDEQWTDGASALYIHNLAANLDCPGAGARFLRAAERYASQRGKDWLRLDSAEDNGPLADYYAAQGFRSVERCQDGPYRGILRQKRVADGAHF